MLFLFFVFVVVVKASYTNHYLKQCIFSGAPDSEFNDATLRVQSVKACLNKAYIAFPNQYTLTFENKIDECIDYMKEHSIQQKQYETLQKNIGESVSNVRNSVIETQNTIRRIDVCNAPLKNIINADLTEFSDLTTLVHVFSANMDDSKHCIEDFVTQISDSVTLTGDRLTDYNHAYAMWSNATRVNQLNIGQCKDELTSIMNSILNHIINRRES